MPEDTALAGDVLTVGRLHYEADALQFLSPTLQRHDGEVFPVGCRLVSCNCLVGHTHQAARLVERFECLAVNRRRRGGVDIKAFDARGVLEGVAVNHVDTGRQDKLLQFRHVGERPGGDVGESTALPQVDVGGIAVCREEKVHSRHRSYHRHDFHILELHTGTF